MRTMHKALLLSFLLFASNVIGVEVPYLTGRIVDNAQILSPETNLALTEKLRLHEEQTTNQIAILTIPTLDGESIEDFAGRVFEEWKLGQKDKDNGILMIIVPDDRQMRIEVGYGLEGAMPDIIAGQIIRNIMAPKFKEGDFNGGIMAGADALISGLEGEVIPDLLGSTPDTSSDSFFSQLDAPEMSILERILIGAFIFGLIGMFTVLGIMTPGMGWFLYVFLIPFWAMFPIIVLGVKGAMICFGAYMILYPAIKIYLGTRDWYKKAKHDIKTKGSASIGGMTFTTSGSGSSWSSGGSSSSSSRSFSGGGGSSGGGGASGGW